MSRLDGLILANRAYLDHESPRWADSPSSAGSGGLLAAVRPIMAPWDGSTGTTWIGVGRGRYDREWTDERGFELLETNRGQLRHRRLYFGPSTWNGHYAEVANSFLWPLFHLVRYDLPARTGYYPVPAPPADADWRSYVSVNEAFADAAAEEPDAPWCWVHDYQLALVPRLLRERRFVAPIGFFLHTPFPDVEIASPYLGESAGRAFSTIVGGMLGADLIGFQTGADVERFTVAAVSLCGAERTDGGLQLEGRHVGLGAFPVGIDADEVLDVARRAPPPPRVAVARAAGYPLVVGLERGDFTKGIPERLAAIADAYRMGGRFAYLGIAAPTREGVRAYEALDAAIEDHARIARSAALEAGCSFAHVRASVGWDEVVALQRDADVVFTSSLADGQNLVPLQAAIAQSLRPPERRAVLITGRDAGVASTYAGFASEGLAITDPLDADNLRETLCAALAGKPGRVSDAFVDAVRTRDARSWATGFLANLEDLC
jgi:trehalose 6-phosphate synthase